MGVSAAAWGSHIAEDSLNTRILTAVLHQRLADTLGEEAVFAVMAEHSLNPYSRALQWQRRRQTEASDFDSWNSRRDTECMGRVSEYVCVSKYYCMWSAVLTFQVCAERARRLNRSEDEVSAGAENATPCKYVCLR